MGLRRRGRRRRGGCGLRCRGRRRGLQRAAPWKEEERVAACGAVRNKEARLEEEGATACKRRWGKGAAGVGLVRVRGLFIYVCLRLT
jgi:hypothetical protein